MRRMDRYNENSSRQATRSNKNQELYDNIGNNTRYTNFTDVTNANAFNLDEAKSNYTTREGYHKMKEYKDFAPQPKVKKELEEFKNLYQQKENKVYDINSVLEEARKNRAEKDDLEEKRKLKNNSYNIHTDSNKEILEKYRQEKKDRLKNSDDDEIKELINTITSKTLAGEIDQATSVDLLSDLMATNVMDRVEKPLPDEKPTDVEDDETEEADIEEVTQEEIDAAEEKLGRTLYDKLDAIDEQLSLSRQILDKEDIKQLKKMHEEEKEKEEQEEETKLTGADTDFYTRSMDLSDQDFEMADDFKEKKLPLPIKIILILVVLAVIALAAYFVWKNM